MGGVTIRRADPARDLDAVWAIFHPVVASGETYAIDPASDREACRRIWFDLPAATWLAEDDGQVLGTYYIRPNAAGNGDHVCNCGYMTAPEARGRGVAALMCRHSQDEARALGFRAMQFNSVVATNEGAIRLWQREGFETVGRLPRAFRHPVQGLVDALVMYKWLGNGT